MSHCSGSHVNFLLVLLWQGRFIEVRQICPEFKTPDISTYIIHRAELHKDLKFSDMEDMMKQFEFSKKLQGVKASDFNNLQPYFSRKNIENSTIKFKIRTTVLKRYWKFYTITTKTFKMV